MCDEIMELIEKIKIGDQFKALLIDCRFASADTYLCRCCVNVHELRRKCNIVLPITLLRAETPAVSTLSNMSSR